MSSSFRELVALAQNGVNGNGTLTRDECLSATRVFAAERREAIRKQHESGASGSNIVHLISDAADEVVRGVFQFALGSSPAKRSVLSRVALCALGGYGRGELNPYSDLDICLLYEGPLDEPIRQLNAYLIPFLWDSGFMVGYSIHSVREAKELACDDILMFTRFLEGRLLAGESSVYARLRLLIRELQSGDIAERFISTKIGDRYENLNAEYRDIYSPEPHVKEGAGGLRDFHTALWLMMVSYSITTLDEAVGQGLITPDEHLDFVESLDFLWRIRNELHFQNGKAEDRLTFLQQRRLASAFRYASMQHFMQDYYRAAGKLRRFLRIAVRICDTGAMLPDAGMPVAQEYAIENNELYVGAGDARWFAHNPARMMEVFWLCSRYMVNLSRISERMVADSLDLVNDEFRSNDVVRRFFIAMCNRPLQAGHALRQAANTGLLAKYIPEFGDVHDVIRYEDFHSYPVGEHTLRAIEAIADIPNMPGAVGRCLQEAIENLSDPYILILAILFHDLGKVSGEVHVEESVRLAREICGRMGITAEDTERIEFLVQHHILMTTISQYRDVDDEHILSTFAETMKNEHRLRSLFLLSYADLTAVGPGVWSEWKGALLLQLYLRTVKRLLGRAETVDDEFWMSPKAAEIRSATNDVLKPKVESHLRGLGPRYFIGFESEEIAEHLVTIEEACETGLAVRWRTHPTKGISEAVVCTRDRYGLFSAIAGCFASQLIDISGAMLFTRDDGWVVDCFTVADARHMRALTHAQTAKMEQVLRAALLDGESVQEMVDRSLRRLFALLQPRIPVPTRITFDNHSSKNHTIIDIETGDRTGLLYDITRAMSEAGLDIANARIVTDARRVRDSFYVTQDQLQIEDEQLQSNIRNSIHQAIHPRSVAEAKGGKV